MRTNELIGPQLDWAVARCEGLDFDISTNPQQIGLAVRDGWGVRRVLIPWQEGNAWEPSSNWAQAGPIIERESISLMKDCDGIWQSSIGGCTGLDEPFWQADGPTALVAAMRCLVASRLGDEVNIPQELIKTS